MSKKKPKYTWEDFLADILKLEEMTGQVVVTHCYFCDKPFTQDHKPGGFFCDRGIYYRETLRAHKPDEQHPNCCEHPSPEGQVPVDGRNGLMCSMHQKALAGKLFFHCHTLYACGPRKIAPRQFFQQCYENLKGLKMFFSFPVVMAGMIPWGSVPGIFGEPYYWDGDSEEFRSD